MLRKYSKWGLGFVHYTAKFTISRFVISRFECTLFFPLQTLTLLVKVTQENKKRCQLPFFGLHGGKS